MRFSDDALCGLAIETRQADIEARPKGISAIIEKKIDFRIDRTFPRKHDFPLAGCRFHRAFEAGRPAGCAQLLGIGADACATWRRELDVERPSELRDMPSCRPPLVCVLAV